MLSIIGFLIIFLVAFVFGLIPFAGPSNMVIAAYATAIVGLSDADVVLFLIIGVIVALGATLAKGLHYWVTFFIKKHVDGQKSSIFETNAVTVRKWAFLLLFLVAATPMPDEPIVITLGLMRYSFVRFFTAYFLGKLTIALVGAFVGSTLGNVFSQWFSPVMMIILMAIMSIVFTIVTIVIMFKVDLSKFSFLRFIFSDVTIRKCTGK